MIKTLLACAVGALAVAAAGQAAAANPQREATAVAVSFRNVDFGDARAVESFYANLQQAARKACDSRKADRDAREADAACMRKATDAAVAQLSRPVLTAMHQTQSSTAFAVGY